MEIQLSYGSQKEKICLESEGDQNVGRLAEIVEDLFELPCACQKLIYKGKSLSDQSASFSSLGIKHGSRIMVIGQKPLPQDDKDMHKLKEIEQEMEKQADKLDDVMKQMEGIQQGFLADRLQEEACKKMGRTIKGSSECFMKFLETLDSLRFDVTNKQGKSKRKSAVDKIQQYLVKCDRLSAEVDKLTEKLSS